MKKWQSRLLTGLIATVTSVQFGCGDKKKVQAEQTPFEKRQELLNAMDSIYDLYPGVQKAQEDSAAYVNTMRALADEGFIFDGMNKVPSGRSNELTPKEKELLGEYKATYDSLVETELKEAGSLVDNPAKTKGAFLYIPD